MAERAVITAAIWSISRGNVRTNGEGADLPDATGPSSDLQNPEEVAANGPAGRLEHRRRCPRCDEQYDSTYRLDNCRQIKTSGDGSSTICIGHSHDRIYVHSPQ